MKHHNRKNMRREDAQIIKRCRKAKRKEEEKKRFATVQKSSRTSHKTH